MPGESGAGKGGGESFDEHRRSLPSQLEASQPYFRPDQPYAVVGLQGGVVAPPPMVSTHDRMRPVFINCENAGAAHSQPCT